MNEEKGFVKNSSISVENIIYLNRYVIEMEQNSPKAANPSRIMNDM